MTESTGLVERLRAVRVGDPVLIGSIIDDLCDEAADAIERLTRERDWQANCNTSAHAYVRHALGLSEDAPFRHDYYASKIDELKAALLTAEAQRDGALEQAAVIAETFFFNDIGQHTRGPSLQDGIAAAIRAARLKGDGESKAA